MVQLDPILEFREDHRKVRDGLLEMIEALQKKEIKKGFIDTGGEIVVAYRCPKCKKVELVTE